MITSKKTDFKPVVFFILTVIWIGVIFNFSMQTAEVSSNVSKGLLSKILNVIFNITNITIDISLVHNIFRKLAHFTEFFILGILSVSFFVSSKSKPVFAVVLGAMVAITDEIIQFFTSSGRAMRVTDMLIDTSGVIFATLIFYIVWKIFLKIKKKKLNKIWILGHLIY